KVGESTIKRGHKLEREREREIWQTIINGEPQKKQSKQQKKERRLFARSTEMVRKWVLNWMDGLNLWSKLKVRRCVLHCVSTGATQRVG
ncbi:hypothetical protein LINGRAHAP2_LOCUS34041, partial [Linum grandiflorum]